jgi:diadenosine tetraphosphate (Ap4A) HIT family hydrolase
MEKILETIVVTKAFGAHQDWEIPIPGFFIVASNDPSKRSVTDFSDDEVTELALIVKKVRSAMRTALGIETVYIFQNEDTLHGFHMWLLPRYEWMEKFGTKIESVRPIMNFAKEMMMTESALCEVKDAAEKVRRALA